MTIAYNNTFLGFPNTFTVIEYRPVRVHTSFLASGAGADREGAVQRAADGESAARRREEGVRGPLRRRGQRGRR